MASKLPPNYPDCKDPNSFESGLEFQDFVCEKMLQHMGIAFTNYQSRKFQFGAGENKQGIEIKLDRDILGTGNVSIEVGEKTRTKNLSFIPSGILRDDNSWLYIQGNYQIIFVFAKSILKLLHKSGRYQIDKLETIQRFLLPIKDAKRYAAKVLDLKQEE